MGDMTPRDGSIGLDRLRRLSDAPAEQTWLAAQLLERERNPEIGLAALAVLQAIAGDLGR